MADAVGLRTFCTLRMSYRSLKRVLGETHLERKCRFLFGACLLLLIMGSFWWYGSRTEQLAAERVRRFGQERNRRAGRDYVGNIFLKYHWVQTEERGDAVIRALIRAGQSQQYGWDVLSLEPPPTNNAPDDKKQKPIIVAQGAERRLLEDLRRDFLEHYKQLRPTLMDDYATSAAESSTDDQAKVAALTALQEIEPVFRERRDSQREEYIYYQPVYWHKDCLSTCHRRLVDPFEGVLPRSESLPTTQVPFHVYRVAIPDTETQKAINQETEKAIRENRAWLLATAIVTVFLSMIALYVIVRYVIVKPLKHLRDVSDAVSHGKLEVRADIHTNDEFEELAASFNRMLHHLVDAQNELKAVNNDLDGKVDQLARANMQLYEMNRVKSDFLANMSHELRTPLNSIIGFSDVLKGIDALTEKQKRYVGNIQNSGKLLLDMINDILDLAKMESGRMDVRLSEFSVEAVISGQCDMVRSLAEEKNVDLVIDVPSDLPPMFQDQGKLQQVLTNLLSNAIKFTPEGGRITVRVRRDGELCVLRVIDTGVGIAEDDIDVIFEKFRQGSVVLGGDNLTREFSGTGLGLSIVKELCILLGGEISVRSELGKGSEFLVRIPWEGSEGPVRQADFSSRLEDLSRERAAGGQRRSALSLKTGEQENVPSKAGV